MVFLRADRSRQGAGSVPVGSAWVLRAIRRHDAVLQGVICGGVGLALGLSTLGISALPAQWAPLGVFALLCPFVALVVGNVRRLLLAIILLDIPLQLDINLAYRKDVGELGALSGWNISATTLSLLVLYGLWLSNLLAGAAPETMPALRRSLPLALYLAFVMLSVVVAQDVTLALFEVFLLVQMFLLYIYIASVVRTRSDVLFIVTLLLIGLVLQGLLMISLQLTGQGFALAGLSGRVDPGAGATGAPTRIGGTIGAPNATAAYLSLLLAPTLSLLLARLGRWHSRLALIAFGLGTVALVLTFSRGGWVAFIVSISILCMLTWHRGWLPPTIPLAVGAVVLLVALLFHDPVSTRFLGDDNGSAYSRIPLMKLAFRAIQDKPLLGVGTNNFAVVIDRYATPEFNGEWLYVVHNKYLIIWAETGIGGIVAFISFLAVTLRWGWQCWQLRDRLLSPLALGFTAAIAGHMIHLYVDLFNARPQVQVLWVAAGLIAAMSRMERVSQTGSEGLEGKSMGHAERDRVGSRSAWTGGTLPSRGHRSRTPAASGNRRE